MVVGFCSDLHLDHGYHLLFNEDRSLNRNIFTPADVLILAGDIIEIRDLFRSPDSSVYWKGTEFRHLLSQLTQAYLHVIYVYGNHEFYGSSIEKCLSQAKLLESEFSNLRILNNESVTIDNVNFFGTTLWSNLSNAISEYEARSRMNDYRRITHLNRSLRPSDTTRFHFDALHRLGEFLKSSADADNVVISHHAPSRQSKDERFRESTLNDAYMSDLDSFIIEHSPSYWLHGHLHCTNNYTIGNTRIMSNPRGYQVYEPALVQNFKIKTFTI